MAAIYISSTFSDLKDHRTAVRDVVRKLGHIDIAMEYYVAESRRPLAKCLNDVMACDLYVGIFAWRYGFVPKGSERSITEQEFREAQKCEKDMLLFLGEESIPWPNKYKEHGLGARRLQRLRAEIKAQYKVAHFSTPSDLAVHLSTALAKWDRPTRTPYDAFREHRLIQSWLNSRNPLERERARQALRNMESIRYLATIKQKLVQSDEPSHIRATYLSDLVAICGARPESAAVLMSVLESADRDLKYMAIFQLGEFWLAGASVSSNLISLLPALAKTRDHHIVNALIHAIEKLIAVRRYGHTEEIVPPALIECLEFIAALPDEPYYEPRRAERALAVVHGQPIPRYYEMSS